MVLDAVIGQALQLAQIVHPGVAHLLGVELGRIGGVDAFLIAILAMHRAALGEDDIAVRACDMEMGVDEIVDRPGDGKALVVLSGFVHPQHGEGAALLPDRQGPDEMGKAPRVIELDIARQHRLLGDQILRLLDAVLIVEVGRIGRRLGDDDHRRGGRLVFSREFFARFGFGGFDRLLVGRMGMVLDRRDRRPCLGRG